MNELDAAERMANEHAGEEMSAADIRSCLGVPMGCGLSLPPADRAADDGSPRWSKGRVIAMMRGEHIPGGSGVTYR